jgi:phage FluMu protein Com
MAAKLNVNCPKCGTENDLTDDAKAEAATASMRDLITATGKCKKCGQVLSYGPFDPFAAGLMVKGR